MKVEEPKNKQAIYKHQKSPVITGLLAVCLGKLS